MGLRTLFPAWNRLYTLLMRRGIPILLLALVAGLSACQDEDDAPDEKHELRNADAVVLPAPAPAAFGREEPPQPPSKPVVAARPQSIAASDADTTKPELGAFDVEPAPTLTLLFQRYGTACYGLDWRFSF